MSVHAVARLLEDVAAANGWNRAEVGRRIGVGRSRVSQLLDGPVKRLPNRETIQSIARGMGIPAWVVLDAYLEALGLPTRPTSISIEDAVAADTGLSAADKRAVLGFLNHQRSAPAGSVVDLPSGTGKTTRYLREVGAAAREGEPEDPEPSHPDVTVPPHE